MAGTSVLDLIDDSIDLALEEGLIDEEQAQKDRIYTAFESGTEEDKALLALVLLLSESEPPNSIDEDEELETIEDHFDRLAQYEIAK